MNPVGVRRERLIGRARVVVVVVVVVRCTYFEQHRAVNDDTGALQVRSRKKRAVVVFDRAVNDDTGVRWQVRSTKR